jgi:Glu-tRNA(Gln) amidotransferase subunit E-like FAD-binding protein
MFGEKSTAVGLVIHSRIATTQKINCRSAPQKSNEERPSTIL